MFCVFLEWCQVEESTVSSPKKTPNKRRKRLPKNLQKGKKVEPSEEEEEEEGRPLSTRADRLHIFTVLTCFEEIQ